VARRRAPCSRDQSVRTVRGCPLSPYMKGQGRIKTLRRWIVPDSPIGVLHEGARRRDVGAMPAEGLALTPAASGASSSRTPMWCCEFPSLLEGFCHAPVGSQPFIRRSPHMMGFGHVPTGSIRNKATSESVGRRRRKGRAALGLRDPRSAPPGGRLRHRDRRADAHWLAGSDAGRERRPHSRWNRLDVSRAVGS
jgi:hypothetical protein